METDRSHKTDKILNLTLEIIYLLTGENYIAFKLSDGFVASNIMKIQSSVTEPPSDSMRKNKKVREVTNEIIELLTGEVPIRGQDTTDSFSMEEWEYLGHKDLYKNALMRNQTSLMSTEGNQTAWRKGGPMLGERGNYMQDVSMLGLQTSGLQDGFSNRNTSQRCPRPLYSWDSTQERQKIPHPYQVPLEARQIDCTADARQEAGEMLRDHDPCKKVGLLPEIGTDPREIHIDVSAEEEEEVICVRIEDDEIPIDIGVDGRVTGYNPNKSHVIFPEGETNNEDITLGALAKNSINPNLHPVYLGADLLPRPSTHVGSLPNHSAPVSRHPNQKAGAMFMCSICGKCFSWKGSLVDHQRTHTGEKPYSCSECGKCFSKKTKLTLHQRTHTGERPFSCSECGKRFSRRDHLMIHQRTHTGVKPYSCSECGKSFSQRAFLLVHQRAHAGVKPYSCTECGKGFTGKAHLIVHQKTHTGEKPHSCSDCGKCFTERSQLLRHLSSHSGVQQYPCAVCGRTFGNKASLSRHQSMHTSGDPHTILE